MDFLANINLKKTSLTKNELKACELICKDLKQVQTFSLTELSNNIKISKTTILRFCQKLGYSGYTEFKYDCVKYVNSLSNVESRVSQNKEKIINIENIFMDTIKLFHYTLSEDVLIDLSKAIKTARRVRCVGQINSEVTCLQLKYALAMFGIDVDVLSSATQVKVVDLVTNSDDLLIVITAGAKSEIVDQAVELKENTGCKMAVVTMNAATSLEDEADVFVLLPSVATLKNKSLLDSVPIFSIFVEILLHYL